MQIVFSSKTNDELRNKLSTLTSSEGREKTSGEYREETRECKGMISSSNIRIADDVSFYILPAF